MESIEALFDKLNALQERYNAITSKNTLFNFRQQQWGSTLTRVDNLSENLFDKINIIKQEIKTLIPNYDFSSPSPFSVLGSAKNKA